MTKNDKPILEFVAIKRKDCGEWAIPGVILFVLFFSLSSYSSLLEKNNLVPVTKM